MSSEVCFHEKPCVGCVKDRPQVLEGVKGINEGCAKGVNRRVKGA